MAEYPSNSNKARESSLIRDTPIVEQPTPQTETRRNTSPANHQRRISPVKEVFRAIFPGGFAEVKQRLVWDIFVPWAQDALHTGWEGLGDVIFPGSGRSGKSSTPSVPEHYSYDQQYRVTTPSYSYGGNSVDMWPMRTEKEAQDTLQNLHAAMMEYGVVSLLDFNEAVGNPTRPTQDYYGWTNINSAKVQRVRDGWVISMPPASPISRR